MKQEKINKGRPTKLTPTQIKELAKDYKSGYRVGFLCNKYNISYTTFTRYTDQLKDEPKSLSDLADSLKGINERLKERNAKNEALTPVVSNTQTLAINQYNIVVQEFEYWYAVGVSKYIYLWVQDRTTGAIVLNQFLN